MRVDTKTVIIFFVLILQLFMCVAVFYFPSRHRRTAGPNDFRDAAPTSSLSAAMAPAQQGIPPHPMPPPPAPPALPEQVVVADPPAPAPAARDDNPLQPVPSQEEVVKQVVPIQGDSPKPLVVADDWPEIVLRQNGVPTTPCLSKTECEQTSTVLREWTRVATEKTTWNEAKFGNIYKKIDRFELSPLRTPFVNFAQWAHGGSLDTLICYSCEWNAVDGRETYPATDYIQYIRSGDHVIDIGAHTGDTTVIMGAVAAPGGRVAAFEPQFARGLLYLNSKLNPHLNIETFEYAVTDTDGEVSFGGLDINGGILESGQGQWTMQGRRLFPLLVKELGEDFFNKLSFIKVDAEGHDYKVLLGMQDMFDKGYKPVIKVEWFREFLVGGDQECTAQSQHLFDAIKGVGYEPFDKDGNLVTECTNAIGKKNLDLFLRPKGWVPRPPET